MNLQADEVPHDSKPSDAFVHDEALKNLPDVPTEDPEEGDLLLPTAPTETPAHSSQPTAPPSEEA